MARPDDDDDVVLEDITDEGAAAPGGVTTAGRPWPKVDALFDGEPPPPPIDAAPRVKRLKLILAIAIPLDALGIPCWTGVPGALLTLWAWMRADAEVAHIQAGQYDAEHAATLMRLRAIAAWALGLCVVSLLVQAWLLTTPLYSLVFNRALDLLQR